MGATFRVLRDLRLRALGADREAPALTRLRVFRETSTTPESEVGHSRKK
jgi:hypothetical protein